jgi:hypothetical protein
MSQKEAWEEVTADQVPDISISFSAPIAVAAG